MSSYGQQQEEAAAALLALTQTLPALTRRHQDHPARHEQIQPMREQVRTALGERLGIVGGGQIFHQDPVLRLGHAGEHGVHLLHRVLIATPASDPEAPTSAPPSQLITTPLSDREAELWRHAARALTLGNHHLHSAAAREVFDPLQRWAVLADTAESIETYVLLSHDLDRRGLLDGLAPGRPAWGERGDRSVCSLVAREARWNSGSTGQAADLVTAHESSRRPVVLVGESFEQLVVAQANLATQLQYRHERGRDLTPARLSMTDAHRLLTGQRTLNRALAAAATRADDPAAAAGFQDRAQRLQAALNAAMPWVDATPGEDRRHVLNQQLEISLAVRALPYWVRATPAVLRQLDDTAAATAAGLAQTMQQQLFKGRYFTIRTTTEEQSLLETNREPRRTALYRRLTDVLAAERRPPAPLVSPVARAALRETLARIAPPRQTYLSPATYSPPPTRPPRARRTSAAQPLPPGLGD